MREADSYDEGLVTTVKFEKFAPAHHPLCTLSSAGFAL